MKICTKCKQNKQLEEFSYRNKAKNIYNSWCKSCVMENRMALYRKNYTQERQARSVWKKKRLEENRIQLLAYWKEHPCVDCGKDNPILLTFDHRDPKIKEFNIASRMPSTKWDKILLEIKKCDVRCVECHTLRTAEQFGWWSALL